ncbi:MAG: aldo/keto reductase [Bryobacterales bacterium]|nr:aldo/keto reductase [Bryobacterales bacterium]
MKRNPLGNTGLRVSELSFGASPLGNEFGQADPAEAARAVRRAIELGINCFDTSPYYGRTLSEKRLGEALDGADYARGAARDDIVLTTKCGRYDNAGFDFSAGRVKRSIDESLTRLRTSYVDVLFAHDVEFGDPRQIIEETIPALREIQASGKARFIGITGFPVKLLQTIAEAARVDAIMSYCRYNLLMDDLDNALAPYCEGQGIGLFNASPLHMRALTETGPPEWHPAPDAAKAVAATVAALCKERGARVDEVALQFCLAWPRASTTVVGMSKVSHVESNVAAMANRPDPGLLSEIAALVAPVKNAAWRCGRPENEGFEWEHGDAHR